MTVYDPVSMTCGCCHGHGCNPTPADGLQMFVAGLQTEGISPAQIETMGREVPGALLMG